MSHLYGVETNFIDAEIKDGLPQSGRELIELSQRIGLALETRAVSPEELNKMALPVIFHVDGDSPEKGAFHVLIGRNSQRVSYFNGPAAVIMSEDREIFQRNWSGIVFYPKRRFWEANQFALISLTITFVLSVIWGIFKKGDVK